MALKGLWLRTTVLDRIVVAVLLGICVLLFVVVGSRPPGQAVHVVRGKQTIYTAPLDRDGTAELPGPLGVTRLEISNGQARIVASPCPYKICIGMGAISRRDQVIACVPNRLLVKVTGAGETEKEAAYDLISR